jgi:hypothetical protein
VIFVAARRDGQHRVAIGEGAPQRALGAPQAPPGLVDVQRWGQADLFEQVGVGLGQRVAGALEDRLHAAGADPRGEELLAQFHHVAARDAVAHRQRRDAACRRGPNALWTISAGSVTR